ncbi:MAG: hypothetical protein LLG37_06110 [Spirochaetia bacterium]|nr:hypothetical protein [Spirochaetia bacterium]
MEMKSGAREHFTKGVELYVNRQYDDALDELKKALATEPGNTVINIYISKANAQLKKASGASNLTDEQAEKVKKLYLAGLKQYMSGDLKGAPAPWKEATAINPGDIKVLKQIEKAQAELTELQKSGIRYRQGFPVKQKNINKTGDIRWKNEKNIHNGYAGG